MKKKLDGANPLAGKRSPAPPMTKLVTWASFAPCHKSKRGVVIVAADGRTFSGNNVPIVGQCDGTPECRRDCAKICIHAEQMALATAGEAANGAELFHLKVVDGKPVASGAPSCVECSKLMLLAGIDGVWLFQQVGWRRWTAEEFHAETLCTLGLYRGPQR
jgi:deoxycytidylate deaminase